MIDLDAKLAERLVHERVRIETPDADTVLLRRVPTHPAYFNKPATNLLVKRAHRGVPCLVCVDHDLEYLGDDRLLADAFAAAGQQRGWRVLRLSGAAGSVPAAAVERALAALGFTGDEPAFPAPAAAARQADGGLLAACATDLTARALSRDGDPTVGRTEELDELVAALAERGGRLPVVVGGPGAGKSNLLSALARRLVDIRPRARLLAVDAGVLYAGSLFEADRENALAAILAEAEREPEAIVAFERLDRLVAATSHGAFLLERALDAGRAMVGTAARPARERLAASPLAGRLVFVELAQSGAVHARAVLAALAPRLAAHHAVGIDESLFGAVVARSAELAGDLPGKAVALLDAAAARAAVVGSRAVEPAHLHLAAARLAAREA